MQIKHDEILWIPRIIFATNTTTLKATKCRNTIRVSSLFEE